MEVSVSSVIDNSFILQKFNEIHIEHKWSPFECEGPCHRPIFKVLLYVYDTHFEGYGYSKKKAKINAIQKFNQTYYVTNSFESIDNVPKNKKRKLSETDNETDNENPPNKKLIVTNNLTCSQTSGISILYEIFPRESIVFEHEQSNKNGLLEKVIVIVSGNKYVGYGQNKKEAKEMACRNALKTLYEKNLINDKFKNEIDIFHTDYEDSKIIDNFANITNQVYQHLKFENMMNKEYSVIASIIKITKNDVNSAEVICLSTGTKCLSGNYLSLGGESLHDCHAEILSRRCLVKYFYKQLINYVKDEPSIFIGDKNKHQFKLSHDISFHLYINTAPCGEARIFSFNDTDKNVNRLNRGLLRSKIENGAGTVLAFGREIQTFDGIAQGERLITMSCSDKLTRWNILGLQGNLLSNFVEPIYLESISIGSVFNLVHMKRTMYGRVEDTICSLPHNYKLHKPQLRGYSVHPRRNTAQTHHCINWIVNEGMEFVNGMNGRTMDDKLSRLCKSELVKDYLNLCCITNSLSTFTKNETQLFYDQLKSINKNYITAKQSLMSAFKLNNFGTWVQKPEEMKTFELKL